MKLVTILAVLAFVGVASAEGTPAATPAPAAPAVQAPAAGAPAKKDASKKKPLKKKKGAKTDK